MALRQTKKISELPALSPASLDTTFVVGISGSTTYKISINNLTSSLDTTFATDLVTNALSNTLDTKLSTSSFNSYTASAINGTISGSQQISDLGFVTGSYTTINSFNSLTQSFNSISQSFTTISGSVGGIDFTGINAVTASYLSFTQSYTTDSSSFNNRITAEKNRIDAILSASNANSDTFAEVVSLINSVDLTNDNAFATFYTASNGRLTSLENSTGSYLTSLNGAISSSSQVIGILSSLNSVSASLISKTGSYATTGSNTFYGNQTFEGSAFTNLNIGDTYGGGIVFYVSPTLSLIAQTSDLGGSYGRGSARPTGSALGDGLSNTNQAINQYPAETYTAFYVASTNTSNGYTDWYLPSTLELITLIGQIGGLGGGWYITSTGDREVRGSDGLEVGNATNNGSVRLIRQIYTNEKPSDNNNTNISITGSLSVSGSITGSTNFNTIVNKPTLISGSSQLTSSFDTRYTLSGSFVSSSNVSSIQTITSASYAALTPVSGTLYIIIG